MNHTANIIDENVIEYLTEIETPFTLEDLLRSTDTKHTPKVESEIRNLISSIDEFVEDERVFHPKISFLNDIPIRVMPTEYELKKGILIPGHRLLPFHPAGLPMDDVTFFENEVPLKTRTIKMKMVELHIFFNLMDLQKIPILNIEDILNENADLKIQVYKMKEFYKTHHFKYGDTLIFKPKDFNEGLFSLEYDSYDNYQSHIFQIERMDRTFMKTLKKVMNQDLLFPNVEKQLLYTYFYLKQNPQIKWDIPATALGPLLGKDKEVTFSPLPNGRTVFHYVNQSLDDLSVYPDFEELLEEQEEEFDLETIDGILKYLNNSNGITIVRALLFDMITQKQRFNYTEIEKYLFDGLEKPYMPDQFKKQLKVLLQSEYQSIKKGFNLKYAYLPITTARTKILEQWQVIAGFLRSLDEEMVELDQLPKNDMMHLMELYQVFDEILRELDNTQISGECDSTEIHRIVKIVDRVSEELPSVFAAIRGKLDL
jgi:hypothetical protein